METAYVVTESSAHKEEIMKKNMVESADGNLVETPELEIGLADMKIDIFASTEEDIAIIKDLFEKAEPVKISSFGIKNRVSIYLNE